MSRKRNGEHVFKIVMKYCSGVVIAFCRHFTYLEANNVRRDFGFMVLVCEWDRFIYLYC